MGRKKKPFIDKKHAQTFRLVPRSHKDPLHDDPEEAQYVLKQVQNSKSDSVPLLDKDERLTEQQKYGIYFDDDYDYLQHLKEPGATVLEPVRDSLQSANAKKPQLPKDLFGSEVQIKGCDEKVLPISGPQPGWDPDIVAALEAAETSNTFEDDLEDDFVTMANGGEVGLPVYVTEYLDDDDHLGGAPWWAGRGGFSHTGLESAHRSGLGEEDVSDISSGRADGSGQRRTAQFTEYSITSSVVPRSEALTLLDDRFEQFMVGYDDSQLGAPEEEEEEEDSESEIDQGGDVGSGRGMGGAMVCSNYDKLLLESAVEEFEKNFADQLKQDEESESDVDYGGKDSDSDHSQEAPKLVPVAPNAGIKDTNRPCETVEDSADISEEGEWEEDSGGENCVLVKVDERPREQWDCESILSTYSNLYNHPTKIVEPTDPLKKQIKLSKKTGIPLGAVPGPVSKTLMQPPNNRVSVSRPRNESKEEKRARKQAIKEERKERRAEKKATKLAFKSEELKLERTLAGRLPTAAVV